MSTTRHFVTYIIVDNPSLAKHKEEYNLALNCLDHMILQQERKGGHKFCSKLNDRDIIECNSEWALIVKIGTRFHRTAIVTEFLEKVESDVSLVGHILDRKNKYYEISDQCWAVRVDDYDVGDNGRLRLAKRSIENHHGDYTPLWLEDGNSYIDYEYDVVGEECSKGARLISNILTKGKKIINFPNTVRDDKTYLYIDNNKVHQGKLSKFKNPRSIRVYPCATEKQYPVDTTQFRNFIGCANGLQSLVYVHKNMRTVQLFDTNPNAIEFTKNLIYNWDRKTRYSDFVYEQSAYSNFQMYNADGSDAKKMGRDYLDDYFFSVVEANPDIIEILDGLKNEWYPDDRRVTLQFFEHDMLDIEFMKTYIRKPKSLLYYSNVGDYIPTWHEKSLIEKECLFNILFEYAHPSSHFLGWLPNNDYMNDSVSTFQFEKNTKLNTAWRYEEYRRRINSL